MDTLEQVLGGDMKTVMGHMIVISNLGGVFADTALDGMVEHMKHLKLPALDKVWDDDSKKVIIRMVHGYMARYYLCLLMHSAYVVRDQMAHALGAQEAVSASQNYESFMKDAVLLTDPDQWRMLLRSFASVYLHNFEETEKLPSINTRRIGQG